MSVITLNIKPHLKYIETFNDINGFTIPNESCTITGVIEINLIYPIQIRQLYLQFRGDVCCTISPLDFLQDRINKPVYGDEIPLNKWETIDTSKFGIMDKFSKKALGYANATSTLVRKRVFILNNVHDLPVGKSTWPFSITIPQIHELPPSLISPHHQIQYFLSARVKLNSLSERFKLSYWNARMSIIHTTKASDQQVDTTATLDESQKLVHHSKLVKSKGNFDQVIQFYRHSYPGLHSLYYLPHIRYRGARDNHIEYEIGMSKFTCLQKKAFTFKCQFNSLCNDARIITMDYYLEQLECYPIRAGDYTNISTFALQDVMVTRHRKFCRVKRDMLDYMNGNEIKLYLSLNLPHISPSIETNILKISHKLRLLIRFENERNMSLSFPLTIGTVPSNTRDTINSNETTMLLENETNAMYVRQEIDQWLFTPDQDELFHFDGPNKLPSYRDALLEGLPPSPFIEDNI